MGSLRTTPLEQRLLDTANAQHGLLRHDQLAGLGVTQRMLQSRREACRINRIHDRVYAFGHTALTDRGRWLAALWACAEDDLLSHFTAGAFHGWDIDDEDIHVTTVDGTRSRPGVKVHRAVSLSPRDVFRPHPFRVTTIPRTLVDLADVMEWTAYRTLADGLRALDVPAIRRAQERAPARPGRGKVTRLIEADDAHTKSEFERRYLRFARRHDLPRPTLLNAPVAGHTADCVYAGPRPLVVELDGRAFHQRRAQMRADRQRDTDYQLDGYLILRLVWDDLHRDEAARTAERVRQMLAISAA